MADHQPRQEVLEAADLAQTQLPSSSQQQNDADVLLEQQEMEHDMRLQVAMDEEKAPSGGRRMRRQLPQDQHLPVNAGPPHQFDGPQLHHHHHHQPSAARLQKTLIVMRGPSGSGKSTLAQQILADFQQRHPEARAQIFSTDDFFYVDTPESVREALRLLPVVYRPLLLPWGGGAVFCSLFTLS